MENISTASTAQSSGIEQVCVAVRQMDEGTQQNAALVEQAAAAAESLEEQAHQLAQTVALFRIASGKEASRLAPPLPRSHRKAASAANSEQPRAPKAPLQQISLDDEWEEF